MPDMLTEDVADTAIGLISGTFRKICACDGLWEMAPGKWRFELTTDVYELGILIL